MNFNPEKYRNALPYPSLPAITKPLLEEVSGWALTKSQRRIEIEKAHDKARVDYQSERRLYQSEEARLRRLFEQDAEAEWSFATLPLEARNLIHAYAWSQGHSSGYSEVWNCYYDVVEIALEAYRAGRQV